jgi:hypothetical protein
MELVRSSISIVSGLPCVTVRSAPAIIVSGPAQRSLTLWPARSPSRLTTLSIESSDSFVASAAVSIATGWNEPVPGRELHPLKSSAFHGALLRQQSDRGLPRPRLFTFDQFSILAIPYDASQPALPALEEVMEYFAELMQRLLEIQSGGTQRSAELITEDRRLMEDLQKRHLQESPTANSKT